MKSLFKIKCLLLTTIVLLLGVGAKAQQGFDYQTTIRDVAGVRMAGQPVSLQFSFYADSAAGPLHWQEKFSTSTDVYGHVRLVIGTGTSTGTGSVASFATIDWSAHWYYLKVSVDFTGGSSFTDMGETRLFSVPYALHAVSSATIESLSFQDFADVDTLNTLNGKVLKYNGNYWIPGNDLDSDTVTYVIQAQQATSADTATVALAATVDTATFAHYSDTAQYAPFVSTVPSSGTAIHADDAIYALSSAPIAWQQSGSIIGSTPVFLGTLDATDLVFKTNNTEVLRLKSSGELWTGMPAITTGFSLKGNDGILYKSTLGLGTLAVTGAGTRMMWYPSKSSFRAGTVTGTQWDDVNTGNYSFASGYNTQASGDYGFAHGYACVASGTYAVALGYKSQATTVGVYPNGTSVAIGDSCLATATRTVAIGRANQSTATTGVAIGTSNKATASISMAMGYHNSATAANSTVFGYYGSSNGKIGTFVYSDASTTTVANASANQQFLVRAAGGTVFYTDAAMLNGVSLAPGSGAWSSISDVNKKENFSKPDAENVLDKIVALDISRWNYLSQRRKIKHIGPMAQDFYHQFHLGEDSTSISIVDMDGVIIIGIQALYQQLQKNDFTNDLHTTQSGVSEINGFTDLEKRLEMIEAAMKKNN